METQLTLLLLLSYHHYIKCSQLVHVCNYLPGTWIIFSQWHVCCHHGIQLQASFWLLIVLLSLLDHCASADIKGLQMTDSSALYNHPPPVATGETRGTGQWNVHLDQGRGEALHSQLDQCYNVKGSMPWFYCTLEASSVDSFAIAYMGLSSVLLCCI